MAAKRIVLYRRPVLGLALAMVLATACTSRDDRAAAAAATASDALGRGDLSTARAQIGQALAARDDISDYWLLSGRIALADGKYEAAYAAFEGALTLDRGNVEALTRLCQIAVGNRPDRAERYAGQLLALRPGDAAALNVQAAVALDRGDKASAARLLDQVLVAAPSDAAALLTRSRLLAANGDYPAAARAAEASLAGPGDPVGRLTVLKGIYAKGGDAPGWRRTIARLARAQPASVPAQLDQARSLYDAGDAGGGLAASRRVLALRPGDVATASLVLHLWLAQEPWGGAMPANAIPTGVAGAPPETRAAFAAYADALGQPNLALRALGGTDGGNTDAAAARARALSLIGRQDAAAAAVAAVLAADGDQPRALAVRASLRAAAGDRRGAVEDLRHALTADPADADTRLALANLQLAGGDGDLAVATLRDGLGGGPKGQTGADPRLADRLAALLRGEGRAADATAVLTDYARANPFGRHPAD